MTVSPRVRFVIAVGSGLALLLFLLHIGCGYRLAGELNLPPHIKTIAVPIFQNRTSEPDIEKLLTEAVIERIQSLGRLTITTVDQADAVLYGTVNSYERGTPLAFDELQQVVEYRLRISAQVELRDAKSDEAIWGKRTLTAKMEYAVGKDVLSTQDAERVAQETAAFELARDLVIMWEGF
jgi:outer membrane lipopolysaccharide assembly protein LptE/RlpB